jgi:hypothetical protein
MITKCSRSLRSEYNHRADDAISRALAYANISLIDFSRVCLCL